MDESLVRYSLDRVQRALTRCKGLPPRWTPLRPFVAPFKQRFERQQLRERRIHIHRLITRLLFRRRGDVAARSRALGGAGLAFPRPLEGERPPPGVTITASQFPSPAALMRRLPAAVPAVASELNACGSAAGAVGAPLSRPRPCRRRGPCAARGRPAASCRLQERRRGGGRRPASRSGRQTSIYSTSAAGAAPASTFPALASGSAGANSTAPARGFGVGGDQDVSIVARGRRVGGVGQI